MYENLLIIANQITAAGQTHDSALPEALRISAVALVAIFVVMALFGGMITLLSFVFPGTDDESA